MLDRLGLLPYIVILLFTPRPFFLLRGVGVTCIVKIRQHIRNYD